MVWKHVNKAAKLAPPNQLILMHPLCLPVVLFHVFCASFHGGFIAFQCF